MTKRKKICKFCGREIDLQTDLCDECEPNRKDNFPNDKEAPHEHPE